MFTSFIILSYKPQLGLSSFRIDFGTALLERIAIYYLFFTCLASFTSFSARVRRSNFEISILAYGEISNSYIRVIST